MSRRAVMVHVEEGAMDLRARLFDEVPRSDLTGTARAPRRICRLDRRILDRAMRKLGETPASFGEAMRALREAVEESIPGGRVFLLGTDGASPIVGSVISGIGIVDSADGVQIVRARTGERLVRIARFGR